MWKTRIFSSGCARALQMRWQPKDVLSKTDFRSYLIFIASSLCRVCCCCDRSAHYTLHRCCWQRTRDAPNSKQKREKIKQKLYTVKCVNADTAAVGTTERKHNRSWEDTKRGMYSLNHTQNREREGRLNERVSSSVSRAHRLLQNVYSSTTLRAHRIIIAIIMSIPIRALSFADEMSARAIRYCIEDAIAKARVPQTPLVGASGWSAPSFRRFFDRHDDSPISTFFLFFFPAQHHPDGWLQLVERFSVVVRCVVAPHPLLTLFAV